MDPLEQIKQTFFQECAELLADLEAGLLALQAGEGDPDTINAVFRAVHSVKGGAGAFALEDLVGFAHVFETTLDDLRSGRLQVDATVLQVLLQSADLLTDLVAAAKGGPRIDSSRSDALKGQLRSLSGAPKAPEPPPQSEVGVVASSGPDEFGFVPQPFSFAAIEPAPLLPEAAAGWVISFRPHDVMFAKANDAVTLLRELARLGHCSVQINDALLPTLDTLDPEKSYLAWKIHLDSACDESAVREVFEFVEGDCDLEIGVEPAHSAAAPVASGDDLIRSLIASAEPPPAAAAPAPAPVARPPVSPTEQGRPAQTTSATIRVDLERIDKLINQVGELVINQAMLSQRATESGFSRTSSVGAGLEDLEQLTREIQDSVMAIRAQPVKSVFQRMPRLVREVATMTGKQVRLVTEGEGTEVDKTVIEQLSDPITHMIRNAIDHGLESPEKRLAAGKPVEGCVRLVAIHRSGRIVIEVSDDGAGINRQRVKEIAAEKGLIDLDAPMSDEEVDNLIFLPGFSTAKEVSNVSGRGVGMDVVKRSIQTLGGRISIASQPGKGSVFTMSLPLTLAVLDGMVVVAGDQTFIAPLTAVVETLRPKPHEVKALGPHAHVVAVRDSHVPLIDIGVLLGARKDPISPSNGVCLLVESEVGGRAALLVDSIQGQRQVVIKSLETNYQKVDLIAAATILGDGRVALIIDVDAVIDTGRREVLQNQALPKLALAS